MTLGLDPPGAASYIREGLSQLPEEATAQLAQVVSTGVGSPLAETVLPIVAAGMIQHKTVEMGAYADQRLSEVAERLDEDDPSQALFVKGIRGVMQTLPNSDRWERAFIQTANGDTEAFESLLETYRTDPDTRDRYETAVRRLFSGNVDESTAHPHDDFVAYLQDVFETDTRDDAIATFLDVRDLLTSREIHETLETTADIQTDLDELSRELERTRNELDRRLDSILEANLKDEGFTRLSPYYFYRHESAPPATSWRAGFDLTAVHDGHALEREYAEGDDRRKVWKDLRSSLADAEDLVVVGRPGTGKSTICKTLACRWYEEQRGTVLYRESDTGQRFTRTGVLEERIREGEGHVLVVVEDAARENANAIFDVMLEFQADDSVSFLLDSRVEEWRAASQELTDPRVLNRKEELTQYRVPKLDEDECARALTLFERSTGHTVVESPHELANEIETDIGAGEMYLLGYRLSSYAVNPIAATAAREATGLRSGIQQVHNRLTDQDDTLAQRAGMLLNILNAAEIGIHPDLVHSLAETDAEHGQIETILSQFTGYLLFERNEGYQSHHPFWSTQYLAHALRHDEHRTIHLFEECLNAIFRLIDEPDTRDRIRRWRHGDVEYVAEIEEDPQFVADSLVQDIFELGKRHPSLASLFHTSEESRISIPSACSHEIGFQCTKWRGEMYLEAGEPDVAETEFQRLLDRVANDDQLTTESRDILLGQGHLNLAEVSRRRGMLDDARTQLKRSIELFEKLDSAHWKAHAFADLGVVARRSGNLEEADDYFDRSIELCREAGYRFGVAKALNNRGMVEKDRGNLDQAQADLKRAIELKRESGHRRSSIAISINTLGEILYQQGELEKAEQRLEQSLRIKREVGYRSGYAWSLYYLGLVALKRGELDVAREYLYESLAIRREVDDELGIGRSLNALGEVFYRSDALDRADACHDWGLRYLRRVGDELGQARYEYHQGVIKRKRRFLDEALDHFRHAIESFDEIGNSRGLARAHHGIGRVAMQLGAYDEAREHFATAIDELEGLSSYDDAIDVVEDAIQVCEADSDHVAAREWRNRKRELRERG